ncbi:hypothetical protein [Candidatus Similichlamydia laticola]|nr:hypothetical protein [Candidatus Similichlamydia laticola]
MSTGGPGFHSMFTSLSSISDLVKSISAGLKTATISSTELSAIKTQFSNANSSLSNTPSSVADATILGLVSLPDTVNLAPAHSLGEIRGIPHQGISSIYINELTTQACEQALSDWERAPIECLIVDDVRHSDQSIIDAIKPLWEIQLPKTDYVTNGKNVGFTTTGHETIIRCSGGTAGDICPLLTINLGPLSPITLIAADLVLTKFSIYANIRSTFNQAIPYQLYWAPCGGCAVVMIRLGSGVPTTISGINHLGILRLSSQQFVRNFTLQEISNNLLSNWSNSLGANQEIRNLWAWTTASTISTYGKIIEWWLEMFGVESAFDSLNVLATEINAGSVPQNLYQDIYETIKNAFLPSLRNFEIWHFLSD